MSVRRLTILGLTSVLVLGSALVADADPLGPTEVRDVDDVDRQLDIRSISVDTIRPGRTRVEMVFWNSVPPKALRRRAARIKAGPFYFIRFWPGRHQLRVTWGDGASACCSIHVARHPDPYTYFTVIPLDEAMPPAERIRGFTTGRLDCHRQDWCGDAGGPPVDRTRLGTL